MRIANIVNFAFNGFALCVRTRARSGSRNRNCWFIFSFRFHCENKNELNRVISCALRVTKEETFSLFSGLANSICFSGSRFWLPIYHKRNGAPQSSLRFNRAVRAIYIYRVRAERPNAIRGSCVQRRALTDRITSKNWMLSRVCNARLSCECMCMIATNDYARRSTPDARRLNINCSRFPVAYIPFLRFSFWFRIRYRRISCRWFPIRS